MQDAVVKAFKEGAELRMVVAGTMADDIVAAAKAVASAFKAGRKVLLFGNGGSAADAQHIAGEFMNRFMIERPPLPAIALSTDTSVITAIANDYAFEDVFAKQVKALGRKGDVMIGFSTSGSSPNVLRAFQAGKKMGLVGIAFTADRGKLGGMADIALAVPSQSTPRIQEIHITAAHIMCDLVDTILFRETRKK